MSWLFGIGGKGQDGIPQILPPPPPPGPGGDAPEMRKSDSGGGLFSSKQMKGYQFDSAALERAAKAARELEQSSTYFPLFC